MSEIGTGLQNATGIRNAIARAGYAFVEASDMRTALGRFGTLADWPAFADSWNDLYTDTYMADGGRYRRRRFGVWTAAKQGTIERGAHVRGFDEGIACARKGIADARGILQAGSDLAHVMQPITAGPLSSSQRA